MFLKLQTNKQTNRQTDRQTNKQTDRQTDRETDTIKFYGLHTVVWRIILIIMRIPHRAIVKQLFRCRDFSEIFQIFMTRFEIKILRQFVKFPKFK